MISLISSVVPSGGPYCLVLIKNNKVRQSFFDDLNDLLDAGTKASENGHNVYFAMASFTDNSARTQANVQAVKSFWLDIDCKNRDLEKEYASKEEGIAALQLFCKTFGFPKPTIVDSGNGWHVYWILEDELTRLEWQPIAEKLKQLCVQAGLKIDTTCTADSARILRIPDTKNYRFDPPSDVVVTVKGKPVDVAGFEMLINMGLNQLGVAPNTLLPGTPTKKQLSAASKNLLGNRTASFKKILIRSLNGTGCDQIKFCAENQANLPEPLWRAVLSVAQCCKDRDVAIHAVSKDYEGYDYVATEKKADETKGAFACATWNTLNPNVCKQCSNYGKITNPLALGGEIATSVGPTVIQVEPEKKPMTFESVSPEELEHALLPDGSIAVQNIVDADAVLEEFKKQLTNVVIPEPPFPFVRGKNGGLYRRVKNDEDGTFDDVLVYEHDLYAYARLYDKAEGQVLACRLHLPKDGIREFNLPLRSVGSRDEFRRIVCAQGVAASDKNLIELGTYFRLVTSELQHMSEEEKARTQMGWQEDGSFVIGNREYTSNGIRRCPASSSTQNYQHMFTMRGDLTNWRKVVDLYNAPGFEIHQFVFFFQMGSPLMASVGEPGMMCNLVSDESGLGKSTLGLLCNSVWGEPSAMTSMPHDTVNALVNRMGIFSNLGLYIDEITNKSSEDCSDIAYMCSHGRAKERMSATANVERINNTTWAQHTLASANAAMRDKISAMKAATEGENMRLFEFDMRGTPIIPKETADRIFPLMKENYGVAGHVYASWLAVNKDQLKALVLQTQLRLDKVFGFTNKERKWSLAVAGAYTFAWVGKTLGLHDFDVAANIQYMVGAINTMRGSVKAHVVSHDALLGDFLAEHHSSIIIIDALPDANGLYATPKNKNITKVVGRYEPDTGKLFISNSVLREYCVRRRFSFESLKRLTGGVQTSKRMMAGTGIAANPIPVVMFDTKVAGIAMNWSDKPNDDVDKTT